MIKVGFKKIAALLLTLALILPMVPFAASAAAGDIDPALIDTTRKGSITVTKYASADTSAKKGDATGTDGDKNVNNAYEPLNGAKFKLFKIADATKVLEYYNGTSTTTYDVGDFEYNEVDGTATYDSTKVTAVSDGATTNEHGICAFSNLAVGIYVLKEVTAPDQITSPLAEPCLISIPMVNTATSSNNENA
ncbi:MAG: pilin N-terminal domain-containing protein, partial [Faecousia sp.]